MIYTKLDFAKKKTQYDDLCRKFVTCKLKYTRTYIRGKIINAMNYYYYR